MNKLRNTPDVHYTVVIQSGAMLINELLTFINEPPHEKKVAVRILTFTRVSFLMKSGFADTFPDRDKPLALGAAVHLGRVVGLLFGVGDARPFDLDERGKLRSRHCVRERGQVLDDGPALLVVNFDRDESDACADVLEGQVEASARERPDNAHLRVQLHLSLSQIALREALVGRDGVYFRVLTLADIPAHLSVRLLVVQVERFLARPDHARQAITVPQGEFQLHENPLSIALFDPVSPKPVVLIRFHHLAHLIRANGDEVLIQPTDLFPLEKAKQIKYKSIAVLYMCTHIYLYYTRFHASMES